MNYLDLKINYNQENENKVGKVFDFRVNINMSSKETKIFKAKILDYSYFGNQCFRVQNIETKEITIVLIESLIQ